MGFGGGGIDSLLVGWRRTPCLSFPLQSKREHRSRNRGGCNLHTEVILVAVGHKTLVLESV